MLLTIIGFNNIIIMLTYFEMEIVMGYYNIAGLNVDMCFRGETLTSQAKAYEIYKIPEHVDISVHVPDEVIDEKHKTYPHMSWNDCEYMWTGAMFYESLLSFDGFMLHSSSVMMDGKAYLFSAPSGTGKSTHTGLWLKVFGDRAKILNDDKPAIRTIDKIAYAYGTPWSGKTDLNINTCVPIQGICFLERATENYIEQIPTADAIWKILDQTIRPFQVSEMDKLLNNIDKLLKCVKVYKMGCNISDEAPMVSYQGMNGEL